ncbi:MAG: hypothetical protein J3K34DRAFT_398045 [Monoraphidium minutum]|nr:MAG: hypothetical protein J3K34DRAFT_398045 [Monoraphidium minutum]
MSCTDEEAKARRPELLAAINTHTAPSISTRPAAGDHYSAYNKPGAVRDWLKHFTPEEEWVLILEADMLLRRPVTPAGLNLTAGGAAAAAGARYDRLAGVANQLAAAHVPELRPRADALGGPVGRRADQVGGFLLLRRDDLKRVAPLWLKYTEDVRQDPQAWKYAGDALAKHKGDKPWLAEMYGYAFAAAKADVWHRADSATMLYPGVAPQGVPHILHYGVQWKVSDVKGKEYAFDKKDYNSFDFSRCPPWDANVKVPTAGLMPPPPKVARLRKHPDPIDRYRELLALEPVLTINMALCDWHTSACPMTPELRDACGGAEDELQELRDRLERMDGMLDCGDYFVGPWGLSVLGAAAGGCCRRLLCQVQGVGEAGRVQEERRLYGGKLPAVVRRVRAQRRRGAVCGG